MKKQVNNIVKILPGPLSYCTCKRLCSDITVDHIVPKKMLKDNLNQGDYRKAKYDLHNLYRCCFKINNEKSAKILGENYSNDLHENYLSRSALYMNWKYNLDVGSELLFRWKMMAITKEPWEFEKERNDIIRKHQRNNNPYISDFSNAVSFRD